MGNTFFQNNLTTNKNSLIAIEQGTDIPKNTFLVTSHWHEHMELLYLKKGCIKTELDDKTVILNENEIIIVPPRKPHSYFILKDASFSAIFFDIKDFHNKSVFCNDVLSKIYENKIIFHEVISNDTISSLVDNIIRNETQYRNPFSTVVCVYNLLLELASHHIKETFLTGNIDSSIHRAIKYIEGNLYNDITSAQLSKISGYTQAHFCRKFKTVTGFSPIAYINKLRVDKAYAMILSGETDINHISYKCGFSEPNYFSRCFKTHYGKAPSHFIKKNNLKK